jgi:hypothetical protein
MKRIDNRQKNLAYRVCGRAHLANTNNVSVYKGKKVPSITGVKRKSSAGNRK